MNGAVSCAAAVNNISETRLATKMVFQQFAIFGGPGQLQPERRDLAIRTALADGENPRQDHINEHIGLNFGSFDVEELHRNLLSFFVQANFFRAGQFFVSAESLQGVGECAAAHNSNAGRVGTLESRLCAQPEAGPWI